MKLGSVKQILGLKETWIHIIILMWLILIPGAGEQIDPRKFTQLDRLPRILFFTGLFYLNYLFLAPYFIRIKKLGLYAIVSIIILILSSVIFILLFVPLPYLLLIEQIGEENMTPPLRHLPYAVPILFLSTSYLFGGLLRFIKSQYERDRDAQIKVLDHKETELAFLRAQLNPHFLFNSLNSIYSLVRTKSNDAPEAIICLSELMRYMLYEAKGAVVPLHKEIDYLRNYINLQKLRCRRDSQIKLRVKGESVSKQIHPILLIPFVENAFMYGADSDGKTQVNIEISIFEISFFFYIKNKIGSYRKDKSHSGIGHENIRKRLNLLYPNDHHLEIRFDENYYEVFLEINLEK